MSHLASHMYSRLRYAWNEKDRGIRDVIKASPHPSAKFWLDWFDNEFRYTIDEIYMEKDNFNDANDE